MSIDGETLELLERRLAERVEARVRDRLFRVYAVIGSAILGAVGFFGYDVISGLRERAEVFAEDAEKQVRAAADRAVGPALADAEAATRAAREGAQVAAARLETIEEYMAERRTKLLEIEAEIAASVAEATQRTQAIQAQVEETVQVINADLSQSRQAIEAQGSKLSTYFAGAGNFEALEADLDRLTQHVAALEEALLRLGETMGVAIEPGLALAPSDDGPVQQAVPATNLEPTVPSDLPADAAPLQGEPQPLPPLHAMVPAAPPPPRTTLFIQYTDFTVEEIERLRERLATFDLDVPPAEPLLAAADLAEIRYFFAEDRAAAERVAAEMTGALRAIPTSRSLDRLPNEVLVRDFTGYRGAKPRLGTLEFWIDARPGRERLTRGYVKG